MLGLDGKHRKTALQKSQLAKNEAFADAVARAVKAQPWQGDVVEHVRFETDGELRENDWSNGSEDYRERIRETVSRIGKNRWAGRPNIFEWIDNDLRQKADAVNRQFAQKYGWAKQGEFKFSPARSDAAGNERAGGLAASGVGQVPSYGTANAGSVSVQGFHYSGTERKQLDGRYYGTGAKGREANHVFASFIS